MIYDFLNDRPELVNRYLDWEREDETQKLIEYVREHQGDSNRTTGIGKAQSWTLVGLGKIDRRKGNIPKILTGTINQERNGIRGTVNYKGDRVSAGIGNPTGEERQKSTK